MMSKTGDWFIRTYGEDVDDSGYDEFKAIDVARKEAEEYVLNCFKKVSEVENIKVAFEDKRFFDAIWHASTEILPDLEVQVVIDGENNCFVTTGSSGYVEFGMSPPIGMKLPIRCWIHTHPFGAAYFSGVDIRTVSIWQTNMECAYVLGGEGHYGFWKNTAPKQLAIYRESQFERVQSWGEEE